jgi:hypothetical protein
MNYKINSIAQFVVIGRAFVECKETMPWKQASKQQCSRIYKHSVAKLYNFYAASTLAPGKKKVASPTTLAPLSCSFGYPAPAQL